MSAWPIALGFELLAQLKKIVPMLTMVSLAACVATSSSDAVQEYLDPQTAATVSVVGSPLVFARDRPEFAANVRDYATLVAAAVNRSGKRSYVLIVYFWSTVDTRGERGVEAHDRQPVLLADDRRIALNKPLSSLHDAGIGFEHHRPPGVLTEPLAFPIDLGTMRFLSVSRRLRLLASAAPTEEPYELWKDERASLAAFVDRMSH